MRIKITKDGAGSRNWAAGSELFAFVEVTIDEAKELVERGDAIDLDAGPDATKDDIETTSRRPLTKRTVKQQS